MKKALSAKDRALHIELVRARAAIERHKLRRDIHVVRDSLSPSALARSVLPDSGPDGNSASDWFWKVLALARRYPMVTSGASALVSSTIGKRHRVLKLGLGLLVGWQLKRHRSKSAIKG